MRAPFITLEGPEGAGKSIQAARLAEYLEAEGWPVLLTREPGGTALGDALRGILLGHHEYAILPESEVLLLAAGRAQHVRERILPALQAGTIVVCDRFVDSTLAYQGGGLGIPRDKLMPIQAFATGGLEPDLRVLIDVPVEIGLRRRHADPASVNRIDLASRAFHERVRSTFLDLARERPDAWSVVDGRDDIERVSDAIRDAVHARVLSRTASSAPTEKH
ncbi:MAG TPA: dTMP kinase [Thermomicrobiales bacterium]|nr:dTMP kinase [Thermomicrobiales bacterium]